MRKAKILLLIIAIVSVAVVSYLKYRKNSLRIVVLEPSNHEFKKKPKDPGGIVIPNSNSLIYEQLKGIKNEHLHHNILSEPELPLNIIYNQSTGNKLYSSIDEILGNIGYYEDDKLSVEDNNAMPNTVMPEIIVNIDQQPVDTEIGENNLIQDTDPNQNSGLNIVKMAEGHKLDYLRIKETTEEGGYKIQLGAAFSESEAKKEWEIIKQKHSTILKDASLVLRKIEGKNERIFYLIIAGTYNSLSGAKLVCNKLSSRSQNCIIIK